MCICGNLAYISEQIELKRTGGPTITPLVLRFNFREFSRTYMAVYGCMAVFGCIWLYMAVSGLYMVESGTPI